MPLPQRESAPNGLKSGDLLLVKVGDREWADAVISAGDRTLGSAELSTWPLNAAGTVSWEAVEEVRKRNVWSRIRPYSIGPGMAKNAAGRVVLAALSKKNLN